ncbi:MAG: hypothetical protein K8R90_05155 [Candidatus Cloacimonetes bacterium]|nr:hypothetical protein [Candidatus Cloacimonadota bacterium]
MFGKSDDINTAGTEEQLRRLDDARFTSCLDRTLRHEGGYSHHPSDKGGRTWRGIAEKRAGRGWVGWERLAEIVTQNTDDWQEVAFADEELVGLVRDFYREAYWEPLRGKDLAALDLDLAGCLFDLGILFGRGTIVMELQRTINALNTHGRYDDLKVDGAVGPRTLASLKRCGRYDDIRLLVVSDRLTAARRRAAADVDQRDFVNGWIIRLRGWIPVEA